MSATFPADVFTDSAPVTDKWISEKIDSPYDCYVSMNREFGSRPTLETIHECPGRTDWDCPVGLALDLAYGEADEDAPDTITYDEISWTIVNGPNESGYYRLNRTERTATGAYGHVAHIHGSDLGLPTL